MYRKRYYKKRKYYRRSASPIEMIIETLFILVLSSFRLAFKIISQTSQINRKALARAIPIQSIDNNTQKLTNEIEVYEEPTSEPKYHLKQSLLTETEKDFYSILKLVVEDVYDIHLQVPLSGIVKVSDSSYRYTNYRDFNKIKAKTIDFVLYDNELKPYLAIELDDYSHGLPERVKRDNFVDRIMQEAGLEILHVPVSQSYVFEELKLKIFPRI